MKRLLSAIYMALISLCVHAQTWIAPEVPGADLNSLTSTELIYLYNVETDAFFINGMTWNTNACATRLTNGDEAVSVPQQCYTIVEDGKVSIQLINYPNVFLSCPTADANNIYVDQTSGQYFTFAETTEGSHVYTLNNTTHNKDLDVTWKYGGHLTLVGGGGYTKWAFIQETNITNGSYALYKAKKKLYDLYKAVSDAGKESTHSSVLATALTAYTASNATIASINSASKALFNAVYADITGPIDVSFLFNTPDMAGAASVTDWTGTAQNISWGEFEKYHTTLTLSQTQSVPQGLYDVVFHALYRQDGTDAVPTLTVSASSTVVEEIPHIGSIDYQVGNANGNNWIMGELYNQPDGMQSCAQALTHNDAVAIAKNVILETDGKMQITAKMESNSQWLNWQGFEIIYKGTSTTPLREELNATIADAETLYADGSGKGADVFKTAIDDAKTLSEDNNASMSDLRTANEELKAAMEIFKKTSATISQPLDWSSLIANSSFEKGFNDWAQQGFSAQTNTAFTKKDGNTYIEKWVSKGNAVGDASVAQTIKDLEMGVYILKASAHNIQEGSNASQSNAWIYANNDRKVVTLTNEYSLVFTQIEQDVVIGFKAEGATGNWMALDNFKLYYAGGEDTDYKTALQEYITDAKSYTDKKMQAPVLETLNTAISAAETELQKGTTSNYPTVATPLRVAKEEAIVSIKAFESLQTAIDKALEKYGDGSLNGADKFLAAIEQAESVNENLNATIAQMETEESNLEKAAFTYLLDNASGTPPKVTTDPRHVRGSSAAFGRSIVSGVADSDLMEVGFCWSTHPNPTVLDNRSTAYYDRNGKIFRMEGLQPATVYYARAYAMTKNYAVGYGDVIKIITIPRGECSYWYNWGADAAANERINNALADGISYYNNFTSIKGFHVSCSFGSGTPTADCGYGGGMRVGPNASYQRTGTILHEMAHGIGVGTHYIWYGYSPLRETGYRGMWLGERANQVLQFFDNTTTSTMNGDGTHMWPYGINGANEDTGNPLDYIVNAAIIQGLCEDGLPPTGGFGLPAYTLPSEEGVKYYIKNESADCGLTTAYLTETTTGTLKWVEKTDTEVLNDEAFAWYVDFVPSTCYYRIRNAKSGKYFTYTSNTIKTASKTVPSSTENFQLMGGRVRAEVNETYSAQGFWIIVPQANVTPPCLQANTNGSVSTVSFNLENSASAQRWIILSSEELEEIESTSQGAYMKKMNDLLAEIRALIDVPHNEEVENADATLISTLNEIETKSLSVSTSAEFTELFDEAKTAAKTFLGNATPTSVEEPFDITFFLENASIEEESGWGNTPTVSHSCGEFFETSFNLVQTITKSPIGTYKLTAQAFQRPGTYTSAYEDYMNGTNNVNTLLYIRTETCLIKHIASETETSKLDEEDIAVGSPSVYIPNTMKSAATHFANGKYLNEVVYTTTSTSSLRLGLRCSEAKVSYWTCFDNFKLFYYGDISKDEVTDIETIEIENPTPQSTDVYNLQGIKVGTKLEGLPKGIYIVNQRKVIVK